MPNQYVEFVRQWAKDNGLTYMCAIGNPKLKADYLKFKAGEPYGEFELNVNARKKPKKKKVEPVMEEIKLNPRKKKVESNKLTELQIKNLDSINERILIIDNKSLDLRTNDRLDTPLSEADWNQNKSKLINQVEDFMLKLNKLKNGNTKVMVNKLEPILYALEGKLNSIKNIKYKKKLDQEEIKLREEISEKNSRDDFIKQINELSEYEDKDEFDAEKNDILNNGSMESYAKRESKNPIIQQYYNDIKLKLELLKKVTFKTRKKKVEPVMEEFELNPRKKVAKPKPKPTDDRPLLTEENKRNLKKQLDSRQERYDRILEGNNSNNYKFYLQNKLESQKEITELINDLKKTAKIYIDGEKIIQPYIDIYNNIYNNFENNVYTNQNELIKYVINMNPVNETNEDQVSRRYGELVKIKALLKNVDNQNLIQESIDEIQEIYDKLSKKSRPKDEEKCIELLKKLNIVTRLDFNKQFVKYKKEAIEKGMREFEKYPPYVELSNCRGIFEDQLLKNPSQAKPSAPVAPVAPQAKPLLLKYLSREELYKLIEEKATPINLPVEKSSTSPIEIIEMEGKNIIEKITEQIKSLLSKIPDRTKSENSKAVKDLFLKTGDILDTMRIKSKSSTKELSDILNIYIKKIDNLHSDIASIYPSTYKSKKNLKKYL